MLEVLDKKFKDSMFNLIYHSYNKSLLQGKPSALGFNDSVGSLYEPLTPQKGRCYDLTSWSFFLYYSGSFLAYSAGDSTSK